MNKYSSSKYDDIANILSSNNYDNVKFYGTSGYKFNDVNNNRYYKLVYSGNEFKLATATPYNYNISQSEVSLVQSEFDKIVSLVIKLNKLLAEAKVDDSVSKSSNNVNITNEYAKYELDTLTAKDIMKELTWMSNNVDNIRLIDRSGNELSKYGSKVTAKYELNEDDLEVERTDNVIYVYFNLSNLDLSINFTPKSNVSNLSEVLSNLHISQTSDNRKAFRDEDSTYLLKINLNTGIVSLFDVESGTFKQSNYNYNNMTISEIAKLLLTPEYIKEYFNSVCKLIKSSLDMYY